MVHIQMTYISPVSSHIWDKLWVLHWLLNLSEKASIGKAPHARKDPILEKLGAVDY